MSPQESPVRYVFGRVVLDMTRRELTVDDAVRHLRPKSLDVLACLLTHAGRVVPKDELIEAVWGQTAVTEDSLVQCLMEIRRALEPEHAVIRTVRGLGYRFDGEVRQENGDPDRSVVAAAEHETPAVEAAALETAARPTAPRASRPVFVGLGVGLAIVLGLAGWSMRGTGAEEAPANASAGVPTLAPQVTLDAAVVAAMEEGQLAVGGRSQADLQRARVAYGEAVRLDPRYAPAHAALANVLVMLAVFGAERPLAVLPLAEEHARRAMELDSTDAMAWHAMAHVQVQWTREWAAAEAAYRRALALDPQAEPPAFLLAHLLMGLDRPREAIEQSLKALSLNPGSAMLQTSTGIVHYFCRRPEEAVAYFTRAAQLDSGQSIAVFWRALALATLGRLDEAMEAALRSRAGMGNPPTWVVGYVHAKAGRVQEAREVLSAMEAHARRRYVPALEFAYLHLALGDRAEALTWLERALAEHSRWSELLAVDPILDPLREEPRFRALLKALGLPERS